MLKRLITSIICFCFILNNTPISSAQDFNINQLPVPGIMVGESAPFSPLALKGLIVNPQKPLEFQFIVDTGNSLSLPGVGREELKKGANQLVRYFLAGLTIPEGDLWVNLSPYEKDRMVPQALGQTDLGRDLLAQDYILKQLTASLMYPEKDLGKAFWSRVYAKAQKQLGTTNVPVNTFNKVWILPDQAQVYENVYGSTASPQGAAYVTKASLKVMLDQDYLALQKHRGSARHERTTNNINAVGSQIIKTIILPEIEKEVNSGRNFAPLRQIFQALILAKWYKQTIQNGLLDALYTDKNRIAGINLNDPAVKEQIYQRYLKAYKKGVFNYIKEENVNSNSISTRGPQGEQTISKKATLSRKYFSGGTKFSGYEVATNGTQAMITANGAMISFKLVLASVGVLAGAGLALYHGLKKKKRDNSGALQEPMVRSLGPTEWRFEGYGPVGDGWHGQGVWLGSNGESVEGSWDQPPTNSVEADSTEHYLSTEELALLKNGEDPALWDDPGLWAKGVRLHSKYPWRRDKSLERIARQVEQIETNLQTLLPGGQIDPEKIRQKVALVLDWIKANPESFKGEELHVLGSTGPEAKVIGRIDRNIAEHFGYVHETANIVFITPDGKKVLLQLRNKKNYDDHLAMYGGHLGVGESHLAAALEEALQETGLDQLRGKLVPVGYEAYDRRTDGDNNAERRSWFVYKLDSHEYQKIKARSEFLDKVLGISTKANTREEYKAALFKAQAGIIQEEFLTRAGLPAAIFSSLKNGGIIRNITDHEFHKLLAIVKDEHIQNPTKDKI